MLDLKKGTLKSQKTIGEKGLYDSSQWSHPQTASSSSRVCCDHTWKYPKDIPKEFVFVKIEAAIHLRNFLLVSRMSKKNFLFRSLSVSSSCYNRSLWGHLLLICFKHNYELWYIYIYTYIPDYILPLFSIIKKLQVNWKKLSLASKKCLIFQLSCWTN